MPNEDSVRAENSVKNSGKRGNPDKIRAYRFKRGQSGNPGGRPKERPITEILRKVVDQHPELVEQMVKKALDDGRMPGVFMLRLIGDRLEGRLTERLQVSGPGGAPFMTFEEMDNRIAELLEKWKATKKNETNPR